MSEHNNTALTRACYDAYVSKDRASMEKLLAEDFHFTSPLDNRLDRATYFSRCWPNSGVTRRILRSRSLTATTQCG